MNRDTIALLLETLRLRNGISPEQAREAWGRADCRGLPQLLRYEGAHVWLYRRVQQLGLTLPEELRSSLRAMVHQTSVDTMRIDAQTVAVTSMLTAASIPWALMKGQARRAAATRYPFANARGVSDVDLLLPASQVDAAWDLLCRQHGFHLASDLPPTHTTHHHRPAVTDANNVAVELHSTTALSVEPAEAWRRATQGADVVTWSGLTVTVPNATELVWQALTHAVSDGDTGYYLRTFLSVAAILAEEPEIDWTALALRLTNGEVLDNDTGRSVPPEQLRRFLAAAADLAGTSLPPAWLPRRPAALVSLLVWRGRALQGRGGRALTGRLLDESVRAETRLPLTPSPPGTTLVQRIRRGVATRLARLLYVTWRVTQ